MSTTLSPLTAIRRAASRRSTATWIGTRARRLVSPRSLTGVALVLAVLLRVTLALVNRDSNDDHIKVARLILADKHLPVINECAQCFQPKLYHLSVAAVGALLPDSSRGALFVSGQLINVAAGLATLGIVFLFLQRYVPDPTTRALAFALTALNPEMASINGMATNDSFVILWSTAAIYGVVRFLETPELRHLALAAVGTVLAPLSKGNGLVTATVVMGALAVSAGLRLHVRAPGDRRFVAGAVVLCLAWFVTVPWAGQYLDNARRAGSPFALSRPHQPWPNFFEETNVERPGVTSIVHSYLTFRIVDLIVHPTTDHSVDSKHVHRTSLLSQLYGRAHFAHFPAWPPTWKQVDHRFIRAVGRTIMVLALVPTTLIVLGGVLLVPAWWRSRTEVPTFLLGNPAWVLDAAGVAFLAFIVVYTARYRDFSFMKTIFILPGLLGFLHWFLRGYTAILTRVGGSRVAVAALIGSMVALLPLYMADLVTLILHIMGWM
jgi:hypothetical protein